MRDNAWSCFAVAAALCLLYTLSGTNALRLDFWAYEVDGNCTLCPPASFANKNGSSNCTRLDRDHICLGVNGSCIPTPPNYNGQGYRPPGGNQTLCELCPVNQYQDEPGQQSCKFCSDGSQPLLDRTACEGCNEGEISNQAQTNGLCTSCYQIQYGFKANTDKSACEPCLPGTMSHDGISCDLCERGNYWNPEVSNCASPCPRGHYCVAGIVPDSANITYCKQCELCDIGHAQAASGQYDCDECLPGTFQDVQGASVCKACPTGFYQFLSGMGYCNTCPEQYYCPNATSKLPCPKDRYCPEGSVQPLTCNTLYEAQATGCKPTPKLMGIVAGSVVGGTMLIALFIYRRYKQYSRARQEETAALIRKEENKHPVYSGL